MDDPYYPDDRGRDDQFDDRGPGPAPFPGTVMAAGVIWIGYGVVAIIMSTATMAMNGANANAAGAAPTGSCCPGLIAIAFLVCGIQTVTGKASDTRGNGAGSLVMGGLHLLGGAFLAGGGFAAGNAAQGAPRDLALVLGAFVGLIGASLILAGILALSGRSAYLEWLDDHQPRPKRRSRRVAREDRNEQDDYDRGDEEPDKPWKRR